MKVLYFGSLGNSSGHGLYGPGLSRQSPYDGPNEEWRFALDSRLLKLHGVPDAPGRGAFFTLAGFTVLTWWDRTGDSRGNSNSAFLVEGDVSLEELERLAREHFPKIVTRQARPVTPIGHPPVFAS